MRIVIDTCKYDNVTLGQVKGKVKSVTRKALTAGTGLFGKLMRRKATMPKHTS